ncbi:hypothetical protein ACFL0Q_00670 [Thermodesulfobacteriota bacterium]
MARPLRIEYPGSFYHATSRGNERKAIFDHYHLLLETPSGNFSQILHHIDGTYTTYFNTKRKRLGHLLVRGNPVLWAGSESWGSV